MITESKAARLAASLQEYINGGNLRVGAFLGTKAQLQTEHQVAAGTLNEAVRLLQVRGYVEVKPGPRGGLFVASLAKRNMLADAIFASQDDPTTSATLIALQDAIEVLVVIAAAENCTEEDAVIINGHLRSLRSAEGVRDAIHAMWDVDIAVAQATGNQLLSSVYCGLINTLRESTNWTGLAEMVTEDSKAIHESIALSVMANDVEGARRAANLHSPSNASFPSET